MEGAGGKARRPNARVGVHGVALQAARGSSMMMQGKWHRGQEEQCVEKCLSCQIIIGMECDFYYL